MPKIRKSSSKRSSLKHKYSIAKKIKDSKKKIKKEAKKFKAMGIAPRKMKKQMGIPNIFPFKEELMNSIERKENMEKEKKDQLKMMAQANAQMPKGSLENYAIQIQAKVERFEEEERKDGLTEQEIKEAEAIIDPNARSMAQSKKAYAKELKKVVEASDVVIEVLDARDPEGCRSKELEQQVLTQGKKMLLVVNKIDLVPPQNSR
jgi:nuclear GTP-binding protein